MTVVRCAIVICLAGLFGASVCAAPKTRSCRKDADCRPMQEICEKGRCVMCSRDEHCFAVCLRCDRQSGFCERRNLCCIEHADCPTGLCVQIGDFPSCDKIGCHEAPEKCGADLVCKNALCVPGPLYYTHFPKPKPGRCRSDVECAARRQVCAAGKCRVCDPKRRLTSCNGSPCHRCGKNFTCERIKGCCMRDDDCLGRTRCRVTLGLKQRSGVCETMCRSDKDCKKGTRCRLGLCFGP